MFLINNLKNKDFNLFNLIKKKKIKALFKRKELVIIPVGFRCYTREKTSELFGVQLPALPFTTGFFSPDGIVNVLENKKIELTYPIINENHCVAKKYENFIDTKRGKGIKFISSNYEEINSLAIDRSQKNINQLLDSTYGYYTLDNKNKFVLAHYNWHTFASEEKSKGVYDIAENIKTINDMFNRRIKRLFDICNDAKYILLTYSNHQNYNFLYIDDDIYELSNFDIIIDKFQNIFKKKIIFINLDDKKSLKNIKFFDLFD